MKEPRVCATIRALGLSKATERYAIKAAKRIAKTREGMCDGNPGDEKRIIDFTVWSGTKEGFDWWNDLHNGRDPGVPKAEKK